MLVVSTSLYKTWDFQNPKLFIMCLLKKPNLHKINYKHLVSPKTRYLGLKGYNKYI